MAFYTITIPTANITTGVFNVDTSLLNTTVYGDKKKFRIISIGLYNNKSTNYSIGDFTVTIGGVTYNFKGGSLRLKETTYFTATNTTTTFQLSANNYTCQTSLRGDGCEPFKLKLGFDYPVMNEPTNITLSPQNFNDMVTINCTTNNTTYRTVNYNVYKNDGTSLDLGYSATNKSSINIPPKTLNNNDLLMPLKFDVSVMARDTWYDSDSTSGIGKATITTAYDNSLSIVPSVSNLRFASNNIDTGLIISWQSTYQNRYELVIRQNNAIIYTDIKNSTATTIKLPNLNVLPNTDLVATLKTAFMPANYTEDMDYWTFSGEYTTSTTTSLTLPSLTNLTTLGDFCEKPIIVNWRSEYQTGYEYECYYNNVKVKNGTGTTAQTFSIPANTYTGTLPATVRVRVKREASGQTLYSDWQERSISLKEIMPTLDNISLSGSNIDLPISISWNSTDQQNYEVKIEKNSVLVKNYSGTTATSIAIPATTLTTGLHAISVRVAYSGRWTDWKSITATLTETLPSIGAFEPDGVIAERDNPIRVWWTSNNQSKYRLVIDGTLTYTGTTAKEYILPPATLQTGTHTMSLTVTYVTGANVEKNVTKQAEFIVQGKPPIPTITSSSSFTTNRPTITWDTQDQQGYILEVLKDGAIIYTTEWQNGLVTSDKILNYLPNGTYTVRVKVMNQYSLESDYGSKVITINTTITPTITLNTREIEGGLYLWWDNANDFEYFYVLRNGKPIAKVYDTIYRDYTAHNECIYTVRGITTEDCYKDSNVVETSFKVNRSLLSTVDQLEDVEHIVVMTNDTLFKGHLSVDNSTLHLSGRKNPITIFGEYATDTYDLKVVHTGDLFKLFEMFNRRQVFCYRDYLEKIYFTLSSLPYERDSRGIDYNATLTALKVDFSEVIEYD